MKNISKKKNPQKFNQILSLNGWVNQKDERVTSEELMRRKSLQTIRIFNDSFSILATSGYWFTLEFNKLDSTILANLKDPKFETNALFNITKGQKLKVSSTSPRQSNEIVIFDSFRFSAYKIGIGVTNTITEKDEIFWLLKKNDLDTQFKELFEIL